MIGVTLFAHRFLVRARRRVAGWFGVTPPAPKLKLVHTKPDAERYRVLRKHSFEQRMLAAGQSVDWDFALYIMCRVDNWAFRRGINLPDKTRALLTQHVYLQLSGGGARA
jgi:hypothetical protein